MEKEMKRIAFILAFLLCSSGIFAQQGQVVSRSIFISKDYKKSIVTIRRSVPPVLPKKTVAADYSNANVFPNPASDIITLRLFSPEGGKADIKICNTLGCIEAQWTKRLRAGQNDVSLALSQLQKGFYFLSVNDGIKSEILKLVKD